MNREESYVRAGKKALRAALSAIMLLAGIRVADTPPIPASPLRGRPPLLLPLSRHHAPRIPGPVQYTSSSNWSGYAVYNVSNVTNVKASWIVPTALQPTDPLSCANTYSSCWVGIDGYSNDTVEQCGTECDWNPLTGASYYAWYEMYPRLAWQLNPLYYPVKPGDIITAEVKYTGKGSFTLSLRSTNKGGKWKSGFSTNQKLTSALLTSAEWIVEAPYSGAVLPLAHFSTNLTPADHSVYFSGCQATINGTQKSLSNWSPLDPITMDGISGAQAVPSGYSSGSFSVQWNNCH